MLTKMRSGVSLPFDTITICPVEKGLAADVHMLSQFCNVTCNLHKSCMLPTSRCGA